MSDQQPTQYQSPGLFARTLGFVSKIFAVLLISAFFSILIEWLLMAFFFEPNTGYQHAKAMLSNELSYLRLTIEGDSPTLANVVDPGTTVESAIRWLFVDSGFISAMRDARTPREDDFALVFYIKAGFAYIHDYLVAAMYVVSTFVVRLMILFLSSPIFLLLGVVGLVDGLMMRDRRRFTAGLESSFVYHIAKRMVLPMIFLAWVIYLALPTSIHPVAVILPFACGFALAIATTAAKFKKYV